MARPTREPTASLTRMGNLYASATLWTLLLVNTLNFVDRQIINILAEPVKRELLLADWQIGAMTGLAFALFYTVLGIPVARLCDRGHRGRIIAVALFVWSGFTALCGMAQSFLHLMLARIGVGIGEAGCSPPAQALITDKVEKSARSTALAFYALGTPIGSLLGMVIGGFVAHAWGWRGAFMLVGLPGMVLAVLIFFLLDDPRARAAKRAMSGADEIPPLREALRSLLAARAFRWISLGTGLVCFVSYAHQAFFGSFFLRNHPGEIESLANAWGHGGSMAFLGTALGLALGAGGSLGIFLGGRIADRQVARDVRGYATVPAVAALLTAPAFIVSFMLPSAAIALMTLVLANLLKSVWFGPVFAAVQGLAHPRSRATATAMLLFVINTVGLGLGPLCLGILSDALAPSFGEAAGLKWAMVAVSLVALPAAWCFWQARRYIGRELVS